MSILSQLASDLVALEGESLAGVNLHVSSIAALVYSPNGCSCCSVSLVKAMLQSLAIISVKDSLF